MLFLLSGIKKQKKYNASKTTIFLGSTQSGTYVLRKAVTAFVIFFLLFISSNTFADFYRYKDEDGKWHFTNVRSDIRYKFYMKEAIENPDAFIKKYDSIISQASEKFDLEPSLVKAVIKAESGFDHKAVSSKGARGLMQLMPDTADEMAVDDPYDPTQNIFGGTKYLSKLMERYNKKLEHVLAAYNAGPEKVDQYKGVPPYKETKTFIKRVLGYYEEFKKGK